MAANESLHPIQFQYDTVDVGGSKPLHRVAAMAGPTASFVGSMLWNNQGIRNIGVDASQQRRGVASALWEEGHRLASENQAIPKPRHSPDRTDAGDAWAKSVGGRLPKRVQ